MTDNAIRVEDDNAKTYPGGLVTVSGQGGHALLLVPIAPFCAGFCTPKPPECLDIIGIQ